MNNSLVNIRAGKLILEASMLKADPRKGLLAVTMSEEGLVHVMWCERLGDGSGTGEPEDDIVVFPDECLMETIPGRRAMALKFPEDKTRNMYFWLQDPDAQKDEQLIAAFNKAINNPPGEDDTGMDAPEVPQAPAIQAEASSSQPSGAPAAPSNLLKSFDVMSILQNLANRKGRQPSPAALEDVLRPEVVTPLLMEEGMLERLAPYLPESQRTPESLATLGHSPQFRQQVTSLGEALNSGAIDPSVFGLSPGGIGVLGFLNALQELGEKEAAEKARTVGSAPMEH